MDTWTVTSAKARFSEVVERAMTHGPQMITKNGRASAVVVSAEEWVRKAHRQGSLAQYLAASPLRGSGIEAGRRSDPPRDVRL